MAKSSNKPGTTKIDTDGGAVVDGNVHADRDFVGRDKIIKFYKEIHERALTAVEEAEQNARVETKILARGVARIAERQRALAAEDTDALLAGPYRGLLEYRLADAEIFLGRQRAINELWHRIQRGPLTILHSESGAGKTSLLQAGMVPRLLQEGGLPIVLRPYNLNPELSIKLAFLPDLEENHGLSAVPLRDFLIRVCEILGEGHRLFIMLDQFEEFFTRLGAEERQDFTNELASCLNDETLAVHWVFALRSEYFSDLAAFQPRIANPFENEYRLNRLTRAEAVDVIEKPLEALNKSYEDGLVERILDDLGGKEVSPPEMQLVCSALYQELPEEQATITNALYEQGGCAEGILRSHLGRVLKREFKQAERKSALRVLEALVSSDKHRLVLNQVQLGEELSVQGISSQERTLILDKLVASRLLRSVEYDAGAAYELAHDYLLSEIQLEPGVQARKAAQELLLQEERAYKNTGGLITAQRLAVIKQFVNEMPLTSEQKDLIEKSQQAIDQEAAEEESQRKHAEEQAQALVQTRRQRMMVLVGGVLVSLALIVVAIFYMRSNTQQAARQLAFKSVIMQELKIDLALLLSAQAYRKVDNYETRSSMLSAIQCNSGGLISFLSGHKDTVWDVAFSPDGKILASAGTDGKVVVWDVAKRTRIKDLPTPTGTGTIYTVAFSPTEPLLVAGYGGSGLIVLYNTQTWEQVGSPLSGHTKGVFSVKFSGDGKLLVSGGVDGQVVVWDMAKKQPIRTFTGHSGYVWDVAINQELQTVASVGQDRTLRLWELQASDSPKTISMDASNVFRSVAFNSDKDHPLLITGDTMRQVLIWDLKPWVENYETPQKSGPFTMGSAGVVWTLKFLPEERLTFLAGVENGAIRKVHILVNDDFSKTTVSTEILGLSVCSPSIFRIDIDPSRNLIAAARTDGLVALWDAHGTPSTIRQEANFSSLQIIDNQAKAASLDINGNLLSWDTTNPGETTKTLIESGRIHKSAISPDGTKVVYVLDDEFKSSIIVWDTQTRRIVAQSSDYPDIGKINKIVINSDGTLIATGDDNGNVVLRKLAEGSKLETIGRVQTSEEDTIQALVFSPDGKTIVGSTGFVWGIEPEFKLLSGPLEGIGGAVYSLAFNPADPDELAVGTGNGVLTIWSLENKELKNFIRVGTVRLNSLAYSPDGTLLAVAEDETNLIYLYDVKTGQPYGHYFKEHGSRVNTVAFSPDGTALLSASQVGRIVEIDMRVEKWLERLCQVAGRNMTQEEWRQYMGKAPYRQTCPKLSPDG